MVHTWLSILDAINRVPLAKFDFPQLMKPIHLPTNKRIVKWVCVRGDKTPSPIDCEPECTAVGNSYRGKVFKPEGRISEFVDVLTGDANRHHNLRLVFEGDGFGLGFALFPFAFVGIVVEGRFFEFFSKGFDFLWRGNLFEIGTEFFHFSDEFVCTCLCKSVMYLCGLVL